VLLILFGWAAAFKSHAHFAYALVMCVIFHLRVVYFEEPWLEETHAREWTNYRMHVNRWIGRNSRLASHTEKA
jgi:protein-S-isoprenylcysteine O-methyltransferase Ste14